MPWRTSSRKECPSRGRLRRLPASSPPRRHLPEAESAWRVGQGPIAPRAICEPCRWGRNRRSEAAAAAGSGGGNARAKNGEDTSRSRRSDGACWRTAARVRLLHRFLEETFLAVLLREGPAVSAAARKNGCGTEAASCRCGRDAVPARTEGSARSSGRERTTTAARRPSQRRSRTTRRSRREAWANPPRRGSEIASSGEGSRDADRRWR